MFRDNTVFIIGAGASHEFGLPVGEALMKTIQINCRFRFDHWSMNCPPFRPDSRHKQKGSSTGLGIGLCLTSTDTLNC